MYEVLTEMFGRADVYETRDAVMAYKVMNEYVRMGYRVVLSFKVSA